ncbi:MAG: Alpha/beta hydrolase fold-3 domain protein [Lacunisphaera sp.]|nr:Alpha/beta hydrolase fold-3 domain protein [Lacunisphaera sp.]
MPSSLKSLRLLLLLAALTAFARAETRTDIEYGTAAGESLKLDLSVPDEDGPFPVCILVHGGGWSKGDKQKQVKPLFEPLSRAGYAWVSINYRLAPAHKYPGSVEDVETAIRWVKAHAAQYKLDPLRIALIGESAGGHLVALVGTQAKPDLRVAAVVPFYAPTDLATALAGETGKPSPNASAYFGVTADNPAARKLLHDASPITYVHPGLPPFLLLHGTADQLVPYDQSVKFLAKLREAKVSAELITIKDGPHGMAKWEKLDSDYARQVVAWLNKILK